MRAAALFVAMMLVAACNADVPEASPRVGNAPVPFPADLVESMLEGMIAPGTLQAADGTSPPISASKAVEIAGKALLEQLAGNPQERRRSARLHVEGVSGSMPNQSATRVPQDVPAPSWACIARHGAFAASDGPHARLTGGVLLSGRALERMLIRWDPHHREERVTWTIWSRN
jgi:hypothetical protein